VKPKVYLETTIPSLLTAGPSRDVLVAGQQQATRDWWNERRRHYELYASVLVMEEAERGDAEAAARRLQVLQECRALPYPGEAQELTRALLASRWIPQNAEVDAAHIAIASVHGMDFSADLELPPHRQRGHRGTTPGGLRARGLSRTGHLHPL